MLNSDITLSYSERGFSTLFCLGVDGCKFGWVVAAVDEKQRLNISMQRTLHELIPLLSLADMCLLDVPIGLKDSPDERVCDKEARRILGPRGSSVFPVPCRKAVYSTDYETASDINFAESGRRLSKQSWGIVPKIKEADAFIIESEKKYSLYEAHPEVSFYFLAGHPMTNSKKTPEGLAERRDIILRFLPDFVPKASDFMGKHGKGEVSEDDVLDAICLAISGLLCIEKGACSLPDKSRSETDSFGIRMQMIYGKP